MIWSILAVGGVLFWAIVAIIILTITIQVHNERTGWAFVSAIFALAALALFSNILPAFKTIPTSYYLYAVGGYFVAAALWALIKWRCFFLPNLFNRYEDLRSEFLRGKGLKEMPADPKVVDEFNNDHDVKRLNIGYYRMVRHNKSRITTWMIFWWASLIETFIGDFLATVFERMYRSLAGSLQRMSDGMASKYSELN